MPNLKECANCKRKNGYATNDKALVCARCEKNTQTAEVKPKSKKK